MGSKWTRTPPGGGGAALKPQARQCFGISFWIIRNPCWGSPKPRTGRSRVQSNTPDGVAFPLPLVACSCTSAQEKKSHLNSKIPVPKPAMVFPVLRGRNIAEFQCGIFFALIPNAPRNLAVCPISNIHIIICITHY